MSFLSILINTLNDELLCEVEAGLDVVNAIEVVAMEWQLRLVAKSVDSLTGEPDNVCRLYLHLPSGEYASCWMEGVAPQEARDGGVGFDNRTEWYFDNQERIYCDY